jgi:chromate transporter
MDDRPSASDMPRASLREVALLFLRLGVTAFGGPAAHIAIMENEVVRRRRWITPERFLDMLGAANLIPGPSSSELAIFIGYERAGWRGLLVAGTCFILPASLLTALIAWAYVRLGSLPSVGGMLYGIKPVVIAIVVQALWGLAPKAVKSRWLGVLGVLACVAAARGVAPLVVLVGAGAVSAIVRRWESPGGGGPAGDADSAPNPPKPHRALLLPVVAGATAAPVASVSLGVLFLTFLKIGALVFGSGYVLVAFLRAELVDRLGWLSESQVLDAVAVGQVTPGPVFTTATFIGYLVGGGWGAVVATIGIFLPGFVLVAAIRPIVVRVRRSAVAAAFLDGVNVASLSLMAVVTVLLGRSTLVDGVTILIAVASTVLLLRSKVSSTWLVLSGAVIGSVVHELR